MALRHGARFRAAIGLQSALFAEDRSLGDKAPDKALHRPDIHGGALAGALMAGMTAPQSPGAERWEGDATKLPRDAPIVLVARPEQLLSGAARLYEEARLLAPEDRTILEELHRVQFAAGKYGACETCQEWIARERLRAVPHARKCIECQRKAEIEGGL